MTYKELQFPKDTLFLVTGGAGHRGTWIWNKGYQWPLNANRYDACIAAVAHKKFEGLDVLGLLKEKHVVFDVKCTLDRNLADGRL